MQLSIVIPTFNEKQNVVTITTRIREALKGVCNYEIWFVDDSKDETPNILEELSCEYPEVNYVHRTNARGLGTAVVEGFQKSEGQFLIVMDADLQHPPELLPVIYQRLRDGVEVVIPSRFVEGGSDGGLNVFRKLVSWTARSIGRMAIKRLRRITDCTGGFFGLHRSVIDNAKLNPIGWKILMEVLVNGEYSTVHEVPYSFTNRDAGESKMSLREQWNYIRHIVKLVSASEDDRRFYIFCFVGGLGTIVNLLVMGLLKHEFHTNSLVASIIASIVAMGHNFLWNDQVTWKGRGATQRWRRFLQAPVFAVVSSVSIAIAALLVQIFEWAHWNVYVGQMVGILVGTIWSYTANNHWTWSKRASEESFVGGIGKIKVTSEKPS